MFSKKVRIPVSESKYTEDFLLNKAMIRTKLYRYITRPVAELAKKAGYDWEANFYIELPDVVIKDSVSYQNHNDLPLRVSVMEQETLGRWLREIHGLMVVVFPVIQGTQRGFRFHLYDIDKMQEIDMGKLMRYDKYHFCFEAGLKKTLRYLLKDKKIKRYG